MEEIKPPTNNPSETNTGADPENIGSASLEISFNDILKALVAAYGKSGNDELKNVFAKLLSEKLHQTIKKFVIGNNYNILVLYDNSTMVRGDSDLVYEAISKITDRTKPILLILLSRGGEPGSAYLIGKLCRDSSNGRFVVVIPRYAKSAATLLATAADEIHMGSLSELGPIDLQIKKMPALGLKDSIEHIAELTNKHPSSSSMFAEYLSRTIEPIQIGYYERAAESVKQYAERLLKSHSLSLNGSPTEIAKKLVYDYKDHGFVIDKEEAQEIFGKDVVKFNSDEYQLGNAIYGVLSEIENIADLLKYSFYYIGDLDTSPNLMKK